MDLILGSLSDQGFNTEVSTEFLKDLSGETLTPDSIRRFIRCSYYASYHQ